MKRILQKQTKLRCLFLTANLLLFSLIGFSQGLSVMVEDEDLTCAGTRTGTATANATGGTEPYTYLWSTMDTDRTITGLEAGEYSVTVTDATGATAEGATTITEPDRLQLTISEPRECEAPFTISAGVSGGVQPYTYNWSTGESTQSISVEAGRYCVTVVDNNLCGIVNCRDIEQDIPSVEVNTGIVSCAGDDDGTLTAEGADGEPPYTFAWSNGDTGATIMNLVPGDYTVTLTDGKGCTDTATGTVSEPAPLTGNIIGDSTVCPGVADAFLRIFPSSGTGEYSYVWSFNGQMAQGIGPIGPGNYSITVTDENGCTLVDDFVIRESEAIVIEGVVSDVVCNGESSGTIDVTTTGGVAPISFSWSTGATTEDLSGLSAGTYTLTVTDADGCFDEATYTVNESPELTLSGSATNVTCGGGMDGSIDLTPAGGNGVYRYQWNDMVTTQDRNNIPAGTYSVTVTDIGGCQVFGSYTVTEPDPVVLTVTPQNVTCFGFSDGQISTTVSGGTAPYTYAWNTGADTEGLSDIPAGTYMVTVTDAANCSMSETITISQPDELTLTGSSTDVACFGDENGTINLVGSGGTPPYTFSDDDDDEVNFMITDLAAGTYTYTVTDANNCSAMAIFTINSNPSLGVTGVVTNISCNGEATGSIDITVSGGSSADYAFSWSNGANTEDLSGLAAGTYTVTVSDGNECDATASFTVTQPTSLGVSVATTDNDCFGDMEGMATVTVTGGTPDYSFAYSTPGTGNSLSGLAAGDYTVTVTDANGCSEVADFSITEPAELSVELAGVNVSCFEGADGSISSSVMGGTAPYTYAWSNSATTANLSGLTAGTYDLTVTDANGCMVTASISLSAPIELTLTGTAMDVNCFGDQDGSVDLMAAGGTAPYTFSAGVDDNMNNSTVTISGLGAGTFNYTVTDANGCSATATFTIDSNPPINLTGVVTDNNCSGGTMGAIDATVTGGSGGGYSYSWSNGASTEDLMGLAAGTYTLTVTDANGCTEVESFVVAQPAPVNVTVTTTDAGCSGEASGSATANASGGTQPYTYAWTNGSSMQTTSGLSAGNGSVTVTDANGCSATANFMIESFENITDPGTIGSDQTICGPGNIPDPIVEITPATGGEGQLQYLWMMTTANPDLSIDFWTPIPNSDAPDYAPGEIFENTYFIRCTRRGNCNYIETNRVLITVGDDANAEVDGPTTLCVDEVGTWRAIDPSPGASLRWSFNGPADDAIITGSVATNSFSEVGTYNAVLTATSGTCTGRDPFRVNVVNNPSRCGGNLMARGVTDNLNQRAITIEWSVPNDASDYRFELERSANGRNFEVVARDVIEPALVVGFNAIYRYSEISPINGRTYYRVTLVDPVHGNVVSNVIELNLATEVEAMGRIFPNPTVDGRIHLEISDAVGAKDPVFVRLIDAMGKVVAPEQRLPAGTLTVDVESANRPAGIYILQLTIGDRTETHRIVVE